jgi:hypothetical protein
MTKPKAQKAKDLYIIRGKNLAGKATMQDVDLLFEHIDALESLLDDDDCDDVHGTEGWRHYVGID